MAGHAPDAAPGAGAQRSAGEGEMPAFPEDEMPAFPEDLARLPPMIPIDEVDERQRLEDLKTFRRYLVDSRVVKCLVKLYQHIVKHEMRIDNPSVVKEFLQAYEREDPEAEEKLHLTRENATLREFNGVMTGQIRELAAELQQEKQLHLGRSLWRALQLREFWQAARGQQAPSAAEMTLGHVYARLCGCRVDERTRRVLVDLLRPAAFKGDQAAIPVSRAGFVEWVARGLDDGLRTWCQEELLPRLTAEPAFEADLLQEVRQCGWYPEHPEEAAKAVELPAGLRAFFDSAAGHFG